MRLRPLELDLDRFRALVRSAASRLLLEIAVILLALLSSVLFMLLLGSETVSSAVAVVGLLFWFVVWIRILTVGFDELLIRGHWRRLVDLPIGRATVSIVGAVGIYYIARAIPSLLLVLDALRQTAPPDATIAGYLSGVVFVGGSMLVFDPALAEGVFIGVPAASAAISLELIRRAAIRLGGVP